MLCIKCNIEKESNLYFLDGLRTVCCFGNRDIGDSLPLMSAKKEPAI